MARRQDEDYEYTLVPIIETNMSHNDSGFCYHPHCPCHEDQESIQALENYRQAGLVSDGDVRRIYNGQTVC
jgi:hypothetical protein